MSVNCLLFYGIDREHSVCSKMAGPARIATELRKNGYSVQIIDHKGLPTRHPVWNRIIKKFVGPETLWVGFSTTLTGKVLGIDSFPLRDHISNPYQILNDNHEIWINEFMDLIKQQNSKVEFIHGGSGDYDFRSYGWWKFNIGTDQKIVDFTHSLKNNTLKENFDTKNRLIPSTTFEKFSTSQIEWLPQDMVIPTKTLPIEVARGCIFRCKFCSYAYNGKKKLDFIKEANTLKEEFERNYEQWGITDYIFSDDTYNDSLYKMKFLYEHVFSKLSFKLGFSCYARLDLLENQGKEGIELLMASGLESVFFGMETINPISARRIGKSGNVEKLIECLQGIKENYPNLLTCGGFILGLPADDKKYLSHLSKWLFSSDNPLDAWEPYALYLRPPHKTVSLEFYSDIDINYKSYGYKLKENNDRELFSNSINFSRHNWEINDINLTYCSKLEDAIRKKSYSLDRFRVAGLLYPTYLDLGFDKETIIKTPYKNLIVTKQQKKKRINDYYQKILNL